jgi:hypothetical protein
MNQNKMVQADTRKHHEDGWAGKKSIRKDCGKREETEHSLSINPYKMETTPEDEDVCSPIDS